jgi:ankyrin repeat protein
MQDPDSFNSCLERIEYLAKEFENLRQTAPEPVQFHWRLCVIRHDLQQSLGEGAQGLTPEWKEYALELERSIDDAAKQSHHRLSTKERTQADFSFRAVLARREHDKETQRKQSIRSENAERQQRLKVKAVVILFAILIVGVLLVGRMLYLSDTNYFGVVRAGNLTAIQSRLLLGKPINSVDQDGRSALHHASEMGHLEVVNVLIDKGTDVNLEDAKGRRPLHDAAASGSAGITERLLEAGATVDPRSLKQQTPLMELMRKGHDFTVTRATAQVLLDAGADINATDGRDSVLTHAIVQARETYAQRALDLATFLIESGADVNFIGKNQTTVIGNALLKYLPDKVDPDIISEKDPVIAYLIEQGAMKAYEKSLEEREIESVERLRL